MTAKLDPNEYIALKGEMSARIQLINTQENTALIMAVTFWVSSYALSAVTSSMPVDIVALFMSYVPILLLLPIVNKSGENLYQIEAISDYISVFYEYVSFQDSKIGEPDTLLFCWESINKSLTSRVKRRANRESTFTTFFNLSYFIIAVVTLIIFLARICSFIAGYFSSFIQAFLLIGLIPTFIAAIALCKIYHWASLERNMERQREKVVTEFVNAAIDMGVIPPISSISSVVESIIQADFYKGKNRILDTQIQEKQQEEISK